MQIAIASASAASSVTDCSFSNRLVISMTCCFPRARAHDGLFYLKGIFNTGTPHLRR